MCGVIAYTGKLADEKQLARLADESAVRGLHAFGCASLDSDGSIKAFKTTERRLWTFAVGSYATKYGNVIAHARYSTSGDWMIDENNQPIILDNGALAFNGCIHMGLRREYEAEYGRTYQTDNDGEIVLDRLLNNPGSVSDSAWAGMVAAWIAAARWSFAGAALLRPNRMVVIRNERRPLWRMTQADGFDASAHIYGSTADIFKRAGIEGHLELVQHGAAIIHEVHQRN